MHVDIAFMVYAAKVKSSVRPKAGTGFGHTFSEPYFPHNFGSESPIKNLRASPLMVCSSQKNAA